MVIRGESFYDWCQRTGNQSFLLRWDYKKNEVNPKDIFKYDENYYFFICESNPTHEIWFQPSTIVKHNAIPKCPICNSLGVWCEENNRIDIIKRWDYDLNTNDPYHTNAASHIGIYLRCPKGIHQSELKTPANIKNKSTCGCVACNSFAQFGLDNIDQDFVKKYWSEENVVSPWEISCHSNKPVLIRCQNKDYHGSYNVQCNSFVNGSRCPYCRGLKVHPNDSIGTLYPQSLDIWVEKKTTPFDYTPGSNKIVYWNCKKHGEYRRSIHHQVECEFVCPKCIKEQTESRLQKKVSDYISSLYELVLHEYECTIVPVNPETGRKLPFDNEIVDLKLIIEVHGQMHYKTHFYTTFKPYNNKTPEELLEYRKKLDAYKKTDAIKHGYHYLEIPYWTDDKKETWKMLIDRKINTIKKSMNANSQA